jgi:hypothetical protein
MSQDIPREVSIVLCKGDLTPPRSIVPLLVGSPQVLKITTKSRSQRPRSLRTLEEDRGLTFTNIFEVNMSQDIPREVSIVLCKGDLTPPRSIVPFQRRYQELY